MFLTMICSQFTSSGCADDPEEVILDDVVVLDIAFIDAVLAEVNVADLVVGVSKLDRTETKLFLFISFAV